MTRFENLKVKRYSRIINKYPNVDYVYKQYKYHNLDFHNNHKIKSWLFLYRLIHADKANKDLTKVKFPKGAYNPFLSHTCKLGDTIILQNNTCTALPDWQLLPRKNPKKLAEELLKYDVISFDVFDTCIFRPFAKPADIFYLLEAQNGVINFSELRQKAEAVARQKTSKPNFEIDIYDIYEEISRSCFLQKEYAEKEIALEKEICYANPYILEVFNLLKKKKKTIVVTSDMYLPSKVIKAILEKNGFIGIDKIFVSCEQGYNKASGVLFEIVKKEYPNARTFAHIGDNEESDIKGAQKAGVDGYYYENCNEFGNKFRPATLISPVSQMYKGVVNNYLYNGMCQDSARESFAFLYAGPIVVGYCEYINEFMKNHNLDKILFMARDMNIFYKMYNKFYKKYDNEYVSTSRFSLQECVFEDFTDEILFHTIKARANRGYTIERTFNEVGLDFLLDKCKEHGLDKRTFIFGSNVSKIEDVIKENIKLVAEHFRNNETAAKLYFKEQLGGARRVCLVDLGWRGSIIAYLEYLLVRKWKLCDEVKGVLVGSTLNEASKSFISRGVVTPWAYSYLHNTNFVKKNNWELEYITMITLECIFTSEENSLVEYRLNNKTNNVEFLTYEDNPNKAIIKEFHKGIEKFIKKFEKFRHPFEKYLPITAVDSFEAMNLILNNFNYISRIIGDFLDTPYQFAGLNIPLKKYVSLGELMLERKLIDKWPF